MFALVININGLNINITLSPPAEIGENDLRTKNQENQRNHAGDKTELDITDGFVLDTYRAQESPYSVTPLLPEIRAPDPFIIQKSRQLNKRVTLNVGGVRHDVLWKMLEQVEWATGSDSINDEFCNNSE